MFRPRRHAKCLGQRRGPLQSLSRCGVRLEERGSAAVGNHLAGDIYAEVQYPFATAKQALENPTHCCDLSILHFNPKYRGTAVAGAENHRLAGNIGKEDSPELDQTYKVDLAYRVAVSTPESFDIKGRG